MFKLCALVLAIAIAGCGSNQVKIEIKGGDGQFVRLGPPMTSNTNSTT